MLRGAGAVGGSLKFPYLLPEINNYYYRRSSPQYSKRSWGGGGQKAGRVPVVQSWRHAPLGLSNREFVYAIKECLLALNQ